MAVSSSVQRAYMSDRLGNSALLVVVLSRHNYLTMSLLLLLVLPLLVVGAEWEGSCGLPPASDEEFDYTAAGKTWYVQYQYPVPGLSSLGCLSYHLSPTKVPSELHLTGNFSRVPAHPVEAHIRIYGNRYNKAYHGIWNCQMSGPCNMVYLHRDFYINHFCYLGYEVSQILTAVKEPNEKLMKRIWEAVIDHPEVNKHKYKKVVC